MGNYQGLDQGLYNGLYNGLDQGLHNGIQNDDNFNPKITRRYIYSEIDPTKPWCYDGSSNKIYDLSKLSLLKTGTLNNGVLFSPIQPKHFVFDGTNDYIQFPTAQFDFARTESWSISFWFNHTFVGAGSNIISRQLNSGSFAGYGIGTSQRAGVMYLECFIFTGPGQIIDWPSAYNDGKWHNAVWTYTGSNNAAGHTIYIDGQSVTKTVIQNTAAGVISGLASNFQIIGRGGTGSLQACKIGHVHVYYLRVLSDKDVLNNYNALRGYYLI